jgi:RND family efflux transporter MFP subunit
MNRLVPAIIFALIALAGCDSGNEQEISSIQLVRVIELREGRLQHQLSFHGVLEPVIKARLAFQSAGVVTTRPAMMGMMVSKGELLATLDNPGLGPSQKSAAARVQESLTRRDQAKRDLARLRSLLQTGAVGEEQIEKKETELAALDATVLRSSADLTTTSQQVEDAMLLAPFDGVISSLQVEAGEFVSAGQSVMAIGGLTEVEVRILLPASLISNLDIGSTLTVNIPQLDNGALEGVVTELAAMGEKETGLFPVTVEVSIDPVTTRVRAGMQAEVVLNHADIQGLIVPLRAIVDPVGGDPRIFVIKGDRTHEVAVEILAIANDEVALDALQQDLSEGDLVVVGGHQSLTHNQQVRVIQ